MADDEPIRRWQRLESETVYRCRVFALRRDRARSPRTGADHDFFVLDACDWVNIVPITADDEVVLVRQFRHGIADFSLEVPGGMIDPEDPSPLHAARREMIEETGYDADEILPLGPVHPNPAIQGNLCHTFLARGARPVGKPSLDGTEEVEVVLVPLRDVPRLVAEGAISHALVVAAFYRHELLERGGR